MDTRSARRFGPDLPQNAVVRLERIQILMADPLLGDHDGRLYLKTDHT